MKLGLQLHAINRSWLIFKMLCHLVKARRSSKFRSKIVDRMAELKALSLDVMKVLKENYNMEFKALQNQLHDLTSEKLNGVSLFNSTSGQTFGTN